MNLPSKFIAAGTEYSTLDNHVPAPIFRKQLVLDDDVLEAGLYICGLGFYQLYINNKRVTKGYLAPYVSNPDHIVYYDKYNPTPYLVKGENVLEVILGDGFQNNPSGHVWDFDQASWRGAAKMALSLKIKLKNKTEIFIESDESFLTAATGILFNDRHCGEYFDARIIPENWKPAIIAPAPRGEKRLLDCEPVIIKEERKPLTVTAHDDGYLYDFGLNNAGFCRLFLKGATAGQEIIIYHGEELKDGRLYRDNLWLWPPGHDSIQKDIYIAKGAKLKVAESKVAESEIWEPLFTYHGFRYVYIKGLTREQAVPETLTYLVLGSSLEERGGFYCSDEMVNKLQEITRRSTLSNFHYFPTDCPQREKNGWTADAALSAEHTLLNLNPEKSYAEWLRNIRKAQRDDGALPGIVPTAGWGYDGWNGTPWDSVLVWLPYYTYLYRGDKAILAENAHSIFRYLDFLAANIKDNGLLSFGLGDWCPVGREANDYQSPLEFTSTVIGMAIAKKAAFIFDELGMTLQKDFALALSQKLYLAGRENLLDLKTMTALGNCQTSQCLAIFYDLFTPNEKEEAFIVLMKMIKETGGHFDVGVLGARYLFHVLASFGEIDLALMMITQPSFPSYGWWVSQGATTLWEDFRTDYISSRNHHFWGDISHWFIRHLAGINYHLNVLNILPRFPRKMEFAEGFHFAPQGEIRVRWKRDGEKIRLSVIMPKELNGKIFLPKGMVFADGTSVKPAKAGEYLVSNV
ncbi:MAG: glycoside hydrolase family 78 protein [Lachnospiraceae bacterium]|nr:glycoside hydrolase family 78 protein [Lachnospiraceae bacterium]